MISGWREATSDEDAVRARSPQRPADRRLFLDHAQHQRLGRAEDLWSLRVSRQRRYASCQPSLGGTSSLTRSVHISALSTPERQAEVDQMRYGPNFMYEEFMEKPSKTSALITSAVLMYGLTLMYLFAPVRPVPPLLVSMKVINLTRPRSAG